jgi:hypothetical protein
MHVNGNRTPFFITASLLVATLALALPDLELDTAFEEPVKETTMHGTPGVRRAPSDAETKS